MRETKTEHKKILLLVKTQPTISKSYGELVCTAGIDKDGNWVRLYPFPFETYKSGHFPKYTWVDVDVVAREHWKDARPESYTPQCDTLSPGKMLPTTDNWRARRKSILEKAKIFTSMEELRELGCTNQVSLAIFKPARVLKVQVVKEENPEYTKEEIAKFEQGMKAFKLDLFNDETCSTRYVPTEKVPFKLKITFLDSNEKPSCMSVLDWEVGALWYHNYKNEPFEVIKEKVEARYWDFAKNTDLHFYMGTIHKWVQRRAPNPWSIIGVAPFPYQTQSEFDFDV